MDLIANKPVLGSGIYSITEVSQYLHLPYPKVHRWVNDFWDKRLVGEWAEQYSWGESREKAVNFYTLIEFYTFYQLRSFGVSARKVLKAHKLLSKLLTNPFPFATANLLTDGGTILYQLDEGIIDVEEGFPFNLKEIIEPFCKKIDFGTDTLAARYYPNGKDVNIVIDPRHQLGKPVISGTNIQAFSLFSMHRAGESHDFIASLYEIDKKKVADAVNFYAGLA